VSSSVIDTLKWERLESFDSECSLNKILTLLIENQYYFDYIKWEKMVWELRSSGTKLACGNKREIVAPLAGTICTGIGIVVLIGWYAHIIRLVQIRPESPPMHYNTALCFILLGIGILLLTSHYKKLVFFPGVALVTIAGVTFLEYVLDTNLGIDQLFFKTYMRFPTSSIGRMSPNSALSFLMSGMSITLLSVAKSRLIYCIALLLAIGVLALGCISLLGYTAQIPITYEWAKLVPMAGHSALGYLIASGGIISYIYVKHASQEINLSPALPYFGALFVLCIMGLVWKASVEEGRRNLQESTDAETERIQAKTKEKLSIVITDLEQLHLQQQIFPTTSYEIWKKSSELYRKNIPWYKSIEWVDSSLHIRGGQQQKKKEFLSNFAPESRSFIKKFLESLKDEKTLKISKIINLIPKGHVLLMAVPLLSNSQFEGFIVSTIDLDSLLQEILKETVSSEFDVAFFEGMKAKHSFFQSGIKYVQDITSKKEINLYNLYWSIEVWPSAVSYSEHIYTFLSILILFIGSLSAFLLFMTIRSRQMLRQAKDILELKLIDTSLHIKDLQYLKEMVDTLQTCPSLKSAAIPLAKFCGLLFPSTSGVIYLSDKNSAILNPFAHWGMKSSRMPSFSKNKCLAINQRSSFRMSGGDSTKWCLHIEKPSSRLDDKGFLCLPLLNKDDPFGLLYIQDNQILSLPENEQTRKILLAETVARQLSLSITSLKTHDLLSNQAIIDSLTGLYNRRYFDESLQLALSNAKGQSQPFTLLMIDVDHFKMVNDTYGHKAGDEVLKKMGLLLQKHYRKTDIICRFGGEEFIIILPEAPLKIVLEKAREIRKAVTKIDLSFKGEKIKNITISIGIATYPEHGSSMKKLFSAVDKALYKAKTLGRDRIEVA